MNAGRPDEARAERLLVADGWTVRPGEWNAAVCVAERGDRRHYGSSPAALVAHLATKQKPTTRSVRP